MKMLNRCWTLLGLFAVASPLTAETRVIFDKPEYVVSAAGEAFDVQILIDGDARTPELDPVRGGLFSFGAQVTFDASKAQLSGPPAVSVVPDLDFFQFTPTAFTDVQPGEAGGKGNVDQLADPLLPYSGNLLMTLTITNLASPVDLYPLELDFFRTLGVNEQIFLNGAGNVLDGQIVFGDAVVRVVPEPASWLMASLAMVGLAFGTTPRRQRASSAAMALQSCE